MDSPQTSKPKCSQAQLEALAKARAVQASARVSKASDLPVERAKSEVDPSIQLSPTMLLELLQSLKTDMQNMYAEEMKNIDNIRVQLEEIKTLLPKKLDTSFLDKYK
jgi:hypothetical protein